MSQSSIVEANLGSLVEFEYSSGRDFETEKLGQQRKKY